MTRYLALDVGDERIGVAISDVMGWLARPLTVLRRSPGPESYLKLVEIIHREGVECIIVGLPLLEDGTPGKQVASTQAYVQGLTKYVDLPIIYWDERLTTAQAQEILAETSPKKGRARRDIDAIAAAIILQDFLNHQAQESNG
jgi:putative Holliday junction resolvase